MSHLLVINDGAAGTITFNRPEAKNAPTQLVADMANSPAAVDVLSLYERGRDLGLNAALALEADVVAGQPWNAADFASRGSNAAARQRGH